MKTNKRNFIYAYDEEQQKIIVIDAETGERIEQKDDRVLSILRHLHKKNERIKLRKFSRWCSYQTNEKFKPMQRKFMELAEQAIQDEVDTDKLQNLYEESERQAISTDTIELRQGSAAACGFLASRECVNPNTFESAKNAARFHCLWAEMDADEEESLDYFKEIGPTASQETIDRVEQKQVDYLLDLMGE